MRHAERCAGNARHNRRLAEAEVDTLAESKALVEAEAVGDTVSYAQPLVDTLADLRKQWSTRWLSRKERWSRDTRGDTEICAATGRHIGRLAQTEVDTLAESKA